MMLYNQNKLLVIDGKKIFGLPSLFCILCVSSVHSVELKREQRV